MHQTDPGIDLEDAGEVPAKRLKFSIFTELTYQPPPTWDTLIW